MFLCVSHLIKNYCNGGVGVGDGDTMGMMQCAEKNEWQGNSKGGRRFH